MGRQSSWETSGSWELGTWRFLGGNWEARVRVRVRESWEAKKMTKKARGIEPCLAYQSWSSVEESADPLQRSLKSGGKILLFDRAGQSGAALQLLQLADCVPSWNRESTTVVSVRVN